MKIVIVFFGKNFHVSDEENIIATVVRKYTVKNAYQMNKAIRLAHQYAQDFAETLVDCSSYSVEVRV